MPRKRRVPAKPIASLQLVEVAPGGERTPIRVEVRPPRPDGRGGWACSVLVEGLDTRPRDIFGEDSLQALCLGLLFVQVQLQGVIDRGSRLVDKESARDFPLDAYF